MSLTQIHPNKLQRLIPGGDLGASGEMQEHPGGRLNFIRDPGLFGLVIRRQTAIKELAVATRLVISSN